jgi:alkylation response protein AidB-like acyl-CoA dehydrogenase
MDLSFSPDEIAFRHDVRDFLRANLSPTTRQKLIDGRIPAKDEVVAWQRVLNTCGWATPSWPKSHGGPGWSPVERMIFMDELHQAPAPEPVSFNVAMIGPVLIEYGTPAQQARFLGPTANCDIWWAQGFSEPGAGSDLASLRTSAVRDGDDFVVNGHKIWQGMAHHADWMFTLVRTDPAAPKKQMGISMLLIDLRLPGVTIKPIITIDGRHEVNEVFLDNVRVSAGCLVGAENGGWDITKFLLSNERGNIARIGMTKQIIRRIKAFELSSAKAAKLALIEAELKALELTQMRVLDAMRASNSADPRTSLLKLKGEAVDPDADGDPVGTIAPNYFVLRAASIYGGSSEVQKTIVAKGVVGL